MELKNQKNSLKQMKSGILHIFAKISQTSTYRRTPSACLTYQKCTIYLICFVLVEIKCGACNSTKLKVLKFRIDYIALYGKEENFSEYRECFIKYSIMGETLKLLIIYS